MLLAFSLLERPRTARRRGRRVPGLAALVLFLILQLLFSANSYAATETPAPASGGFWAGLTVGCVLVIVAVVFFRSRIKTAERAAVRARELADHREYERNIAQQELLRRPEEERELAKEKMQFESQLSEYEKYASLA